MAKILQKINGNKKHILTATQVGALLAIATLLWRLFVALQPIAADAIEAKTLAVTAHHKVDTLNLKHNTEVHNAKIFDNEEKLAAHKRFLAVENKAHTNELDLVQTRATYENISQSLTEFRGEQKKMAAGVQAIVTDVAVIKKQVDNLERVD